MKTDNLTRLDEIWPQWWIYPPRSAQFFDLLGRFAIINDQGQLKPSGTVIDICKGKIGKNRAAVICYTAHSYTIDEDGEEYEDEPGAITGQLKWWPMAGGAPAINVTVTYPDNDGYVGAPGPFGQKNDGYNETFSPGRDICDPPYIILQPEQSYGLRFTILTPESGKVIPEGGNRYIQGRITGWSVPLPPGKISR
jgi:hypothetical protein